MGSKVSVIIPVYQAEEYLAQCVSSVLTQTYADIELVLVDDGGVDVCPQMCDAFAVQDARVVCVHQHNTGQSFARKAGVAAASGDYFMFIDADDWIEPDTIASCVSATEQYGADVVCFGYKRVYENKTFDTPLIHTKQAVLTLDVKEVQRRMVGLVGTELSHVEEIDRLTPMWGKMYHKAVIKAGKWVSERETGSLEDAIFNLFALEACQNIIYLNRFLYNYRKTNEGATTSNYRAELVEQWKVVYTYFKTFIHQNQCDSHFDEALQNRIALGLIGVGLNELSSKKTYAQKAAYLKSVLSEKHYEDAYQRLNFNYFPFKWKVFFGYANISR